MKKRLALLFIFSGILCAAEKADPFSKIEIKSDSAILKRDKLNKNMYCLQYENNVFVKFADNSSITSGILDIFFKKDKDVDKIVFKKNVFLKRLGQSAKADIVEIFVAEKLCKLNGNISVIQKANEKKGVPIKTKCSEAQFNWGDEEILLMGSKSQPVDTVIELGDKLKRRGIAKEKKKT